MSLKDIYMKQNRLLELWQIEEKTGEDVKEILILTEDLKFQQEGFIEWAIDKVKHFEALSNSKKAYAKELTDSARVLNNKATYIKEISDRLMKDLGIEKLECHAGTISYRRSTAVEITDELLIPNEYKTTVETIKIDKMALKKALKDSDVLGAVLINNKNIQVKG